MNIELLINTRSRQSRQQRAEISKSLKKYKLMPTHTNVLTKKQSTLDLLNEIKSRNPDLLIVGGGDGTITKIVPSFIGSTTAIGIIPLGTTNNFARSLNIPLDIDGAVEVIKNAKPRAVDLGTIKNEHFTNVAGLGLSATIANKVTDNAKKRWGRFAYTVVGMRHFFTHKPFVVVLEDENRKLAINFETHQLIVANGRFHAGRQIAEDATLQDKQLIIFALGGRSKLSFAWSMLDFYVGKRKRVDHASYLIGKSVRISTSTPQLIELDGEVRHKTPVAAKVVPTALKIRYNP